jgi:RNA polymerase sigma-70 factor (ECF subfamily)
VTQAEVECSEVARSSPERDLEVQQAMSLLDRLLEQLPLSLRLVFVLAEIEELSLADIAKLEDIPQGTAASRLRRARELFQAELERVESRERFIQQAGTRRK